MKGYKEKQYLIFKFENGKEVSYNLATHECIGFSGKVVKDVCSQLRGYSIGQVINSFDDENYKRFLTYVDNEINPSYWRRNRNNCTPISNVGTFLKRLAGYSNYEQVFSSGIKNVGSLRTEFKDIPKGLIKICREYGSELNEKLCKTYEVKADMINYICKMDEKECIDKSTIIEWITYDDLSRRYYVGHKPSLYNLLNEYNYNLKALLNYLEYLHDYEGIDNIEVVISELYDYVRMVSKISNKYEKYPKNFLTTHKITARNYNRLKIEYSEELFNNIRNEKLEFTYKKYKIVYPKTTQDIKDESVNLQHCVSSYIPKVLDGKCHIMFLRKKDDLDKSLVTLEVRDGKIVQNRGLFNRSTNKEENEVIEKYNNRMNRGRKIAC